MFKHITVGEDQIVYDVNGEEIGRINKNEFQSEYLAISGQNDLYPSELLALLKYFVKTHWSDPKWRCLRDEIREELFMVLEEEG